MNIEMYVIYDSKAKLYNKPFYMVNKGVALRAAQDLIDDPKTDIARNPEDFTMWHIGSYDDNTAKLTIHEKRECICSFVELSPRIPKYTEMTETAQQAIDEIQETREAI